MDFDPKERVLSFQVPDVCAKFRRNWFKIATVRARTDTYIHRVRKKRGRKRYNNILSNNFKKLKRIDVIFARQHQ